MSRRWLFADQALYWGDTGLYFFPLTHFLRANLLQGRLPLWDPAIFGGVPFVGNPQMWPLYPSTTLLAWLPASRFLTFSCALHVALTGMFFFLFLRRGQFSVSFWPALLGATGWMLGGYFVSKAQYPNMLQALAWTPLVLLLAGKLATVPSARLTVQLGTALGLQVLAAHAQVTLYTIYLAIFYGVSAAWKVNKKLSLPTVGWGIVAATLALTLSCAEWLPVVAARRLAVRQVLPLSDVNRLHLAPMEWTNFLLPWRYGSPLRGDYTGPSAFWETACYAGTLTAMLALFCVISAARHKIKGRGLAARGLPPPRPATVGLAVAFWAFVCFTSVWLAFGASGGLFRLAYAAVPGFRLFHDPARLLLGAAIGIPVLAALGLETLSQELHRRDTRVAHWLAPLVVVLTALDLGQFDAGLYPLLPVAQLESLGKVSPILAALRTDSALNTHQGRVLAVDDDYADNQYINWLDFRPGPGYWGHLGDTALPNLSLAADIWDAGGYEPLALRGPGEIAQVAGQTVDLSDDPRAHQQLAATVAPWMGLMAVRDVVIYRPTSLAPLPGLTPIMRWQDGPNRGVLYRNASFEPRARLYRTWQPTVGPVKPKILLAALRSAGALGRPLVENAPPAPAVSSVLPSSLLMTSDTADDIHIVLPSAAASTLCVQADTNFPGWRATLDRRAEPILAVDGVYRGVFVPAHARLERLEFRYRPESFLLGFYLTGLTGMFLTFYGMVSHTRRRKH